MISISDIESRLPDLLTDEDHDFWLENFHKASINEAYIEIKRLLLSSDKVGKADTSVLTLVAGALQVLPDGCARLVDVLSDGCGNPVSEKSLDELNGFDPCWKSADQINGIEFYLYNQESHSLWVYPNAKDGDTLSITCIPKIENLADDATEMDLDAEYLNDVIHYCLFRAYQREGTQTHKEAFYRSAFYEAFGLKVRMDSNELNKEHPDG